MSFLLWLGAAAVAAYIGCSVYLVVMESRLMYHPTKALTLTPAHHRLPFDDVTLTTEDGENVHAWWIPVTGANVTVLLCHGNSGNLSDVVDTIAIMHEAGVSVLAFDYRGYGASSGRPSEKGTYADAKAAWRYLVETRGLRPDDIVIFGRSLGAAVATWLATEVRPRALVIESGFASLPELAQRLYPWLPVRFLASIRYENERRMPRVTCPALFIHSRDDELIPIEHGRRLHAAHPGPKQFLEISGAHGNGYQTSGLLYAEPLRAFLRDHGKPS